MNTGRLIMFVLVFAGVVFGTLGAVFFVAAQDGVQNAVSDRGIVRAGQGQQPVFEYHALFTASDAISRALQLYPDKPHFNEIARLKTEYDGATWEDSATPIPGDYDPNRMSLPIWIVGILGSDLDGCDMSPVLMCDDHPIDGLYYMLDPANAMVLTIGELSLSMHQTLNAMSSDSFQIQAATPLTLPSTPVLTPPPPVMTSTPVP